MITLNKDILAVAKMASKNKFRPVLTHVLIDDKKAVATDSYRLLEATHRETGEDHSIAKGGVLIPAGQLLKRIKFPRRKSLLEQTHIALDKVSKTEVGISTTDPEVKTQITMNRLDKEFPAYEKIMPKEEPKARARVNAQLLRELLECFNDGFQSEVYINFYGEFDALMIEGNSAKNDNLRGLIMPLK